MCELGADDRLSDLHIIRHVLRFRQERNNSVQLRDMPSSEHVP